MDGKSLGDAMAKGWVLSLVLVGTAMLLFGCGIGVLIAFLVG